MDSILNMENFQPSSLDAAMETISTCKIGEFDNESFSSLLISLIERKEVSKTIHHLAEKYFGYADVRYYALKTIAKYLQGMCRRINENTDNDKIADLTDLLLCVPPKLETCKDSEGRLRSLCAASEAGLAAPALSGYPSQRKRKRMDRLAGARGAKWMDPKEQQRQFSSAWTGLLSQDLNESLALTILEKMPKEILPNLSSPLVLSDFLTGYLNRGGLCGLLALQGIFYLMTEHNLEYPEFYKRVYSLLELEIFDSKNKSTFFRLLDSFLRSGLIPAYTMAAFVKRFARLSLRASPQGAMICITFIHNLIRRHPSCNVLLDRRSKGEKQRVSYDEWRYFDCFDEAAVDPSESRAIESSLWEIEALGNHWCKPVAEHAEVLLKDLTRREKSTEENLSEVLGINHDSILEQLLKGDIDVPLRKCISWL